MSEKKRTTVTTIETHEVWIIRKAVPSGLGVGELAPVLAPSAPDSSSIQSDDDSAKASEGERG